MTFKKLSIGTAAFGMRYGILNNKNGLEIYEISKILELSQDAGIEKIDTAFNYANAHKLLGLCLPKNHTFRITTKISFNSYLDDELIFLEKKIISLLKSLRIDLLDSILLHNTNDIKNKKILDWLFKLREKGITKKIGLSSYINELSEEICIEGLDKIQVPISCVDQRFLNDLVNKKPYLNHFSHVAARSVFLQGILIEKKERLPKFLNSNDLIKIKSWRNKLKDSNIDPQIYCISYLINQKKINEIIIGISSIKDVEELINNKEKYKLNIINNIEPPHLSNKALDPRLWPKI
mgnify:CR=1 FL=1